MSLVRVLILAILHITLLVPVNPSGFDLPSKTTYCPIDKRSWEDRASQRNCSGQLKYVCMLDTTSESLVEVCIEDVKIPAGKVGCPAVAVKLHRPHPDALGPCPPNITGCPPGDHKGYNTSELYKYKECFKPDSHRGILDQDPITRASTPEQNEKPRTNACEITCFSPIALAVFVTFLVVFMATTFTMCLVLRLLKKKGIIQFELKSRERGDEENEETVPLMNEQRVEQRFHGGLEQDLIGMRLQQLDELKKILSQSGNNIVVLRGIRGSGKSFAVSWVRKKLHPKKITMITVNCSDKGAVIGNFCDGLPTIISSHIERKPTNMEQFNELLDFIRLTLSKEHRDLWLVLEHVSDEQIDDESEAVTMLINEFRERRKTKVILTTESNTVLSSKTDIQCIDFRGFTEDEAVEYLMRTLRNHDIDTDEEECKQLAKHLSCLPLALVSAVRYMNESRKTPGKFCEILESAHDTATTKDKYTFFSLLYEMIESTQQKDDDLSELFGILQFFAHCHIPVYVFSVFQCPTSDKATEKFELQTDKFIRELRKLSFAKVLGTNDDRVLELEEIVKVAYSKITSVKQKNFLLLKFLKCLTWLLSKSPDKAVQDRNEKILPHAEYALDLENIFQHPYTLEQCVVKIMVLDRLRSLYDSEKDKEKRITYATKATACITDDLLKKTLEDMLSSTSEKETERKVCEKITCMIKDILDEYLSTEGETIASLAEEYVLQKFRTSGHVKFLTQALDKKELEYKHRLSKSELHTLKMKKFTVPEKDLPKNFLYELIVTVLYSFGKCLAEDKNTSGSREADMQQRANRLVRVGYYLALANVNSEDRESTALSLINVSTRGMASMLWMQNESSPEYIEDLNQLVGELQKFRKNINSNVRVFGICVSKIKDDPQCTERIYVSLIRCYDRLCSLDDKFRKDNRKDIIKLFEELENSTNSEGFDKIQRKYIELTKIKDEARANK